LGALASESLKVKAIIIERPRDPVYFFFQTPELFQLPLFSSTTTHRLFSFLPRLSPSRSTIMAAPARSILKAVSPLQSLSISFAHVQYFSRVHPCCEPHFLRFGGLRRLHDHSHSRRDLLSLSLLRKRMSVPLCRQFL
jgi:hypothetical protein